MRHPLVHFARALVLAAIPLTSSADLSAQDIPGGDGPFGLREAVFPVESVSPPSPAPGAVLGVAGSPARVSPRIELQFTPTALAANNLSTYGAHMGIVADELLAGRSITLRGGYRRIDLAEGEDRNRWMVDGRLPVTRGATAHGTAATLVGEYMHTTVAGSKYKAGAALDQRVSAKVAVGATGFYVGNESEQGLGASTSATYVISSESRLQLSYRFPNEVETERDYSLTLNQFLFRTQGNVEMRLIVGAARGRAVWATLSFIRPSLRS
jgi:hypothetical protein